MVSYWSYRDPSVYYLPKVDWNYYWKSLGYDESSTAFPTSLPDGYTGLKVGEFIRNDDMVFKPPSGWIPPGPLRGCQIAPRYVCVARKEGLDLGLTWKCKRPGCKNRENDVGHKCYWCGGDEE